MKVIFAFTSITLKAVTSAKMRLKRHGAVYKKYSFGTIIWFGLFPFWASMSFFILSSIYSILSVLCPLFILSSIFSILYFFYPLVYLFSLYSVPSYTLSLHWLRNICKLRQTKTWMNEIKEICSLYNLGKQNDRKWSW